MDKMVSIKGLVIRSTPVIPDMKTGMTQYKLSLETSLIVFSLLSLPGLQSRCERIFGQRKDRRAY